MWQASWPFFCALFAVVLAPPVLAQSVPALDGVQVLQAPVLGQPLYARLRMPTADDWQLADAQAYAALEWTPAPEIAKARWQAVGARQPGMFELFSEGRVESPVLTVLLQSTGAGEQQRVLTLLPDLPIGGGAPAQSTAAQAAGIGGVVAETPRRSLQRLQLLQPRQAEVLGEYERVRLFQLETEALLLRESMIALESEQAQLTQRVHDAEARATSAETAILRAQDEVKRLRDRLYSRDSALQTLREQVVLGMWIASGVALVLVLGLALWWRSELPDRKILQDARANLLWRTEQDMQTESAAVAQMPTHETIAAEVAETVVPVPVVANVVQVDPFMLDMAQAHLDLGDVVAADAAVQALEQQAAGNPRVLALRAAIQRYRAAESGQA